MAHYQRLLLIANANLKEAPALLRAIALVRASGAMLDVRAFIEPTPMAHVWEESRDEEGDQRYQRHYLHWRDQTLQRLNAQGLEVNVQVDFTCDPLLDILKCVEELKPDLVIKDVMLDPGTWTDVRHTFGLPFAAWMSRCVAPGQPGPS